jgi:hypothetical protein
MFICIKLLSATATNLGGEYSRLDLNWNKIFSSHECGRETSIHLIYVGLDCESILPLIVQPFDFYTYLTFFIPLLEVVIAITVKN